MKYMIAVAFVLAGCTPAGPSTKDRDAPKDWKVFTTPGANYHYVFPVVMDDGTRCTGGIMSLPPLPHHPEPHTYTWTKCELEAINKYGRACFEEGRNSTPPLEPMTEVADRCAHRLALMLECVLADKSFYNEALNALGEYRSAMNAIHEDQCPTFMGEPVWRKKT